MSLTTVRGRNSEREERLSLEHARVMPSSRKEEENETNSNRNLYGEHGMHVNDSNSINESRYNDVSYNDFNRSAFDINHESSTNNFPRLLKSTSTAFPLLEDEDCLAVSMTHYRLQQTDETNLENTISNKYDSNVSYYNTWRGLERSPSIAPYNDITLHERHLRPWVNSRQENKMYGESTYKKEKLSTSELFSPFDANMNPHIDKINSTIGRSWKHSSCIDSNSKKNEYGRRNAWGQHKMNNSGFTTNPVRSGLVQSVSRSIEREHSTDVIAPWKLIGDAKSFDNLFHIRRTLQSRAFVWTEKVSNNQEWSKLTGTKTTRADFRYSNELERKKKNDNSSVQNSRNNSSNITFSNNKFSNNSSGGNNDENCNSDEIKSTWLNNLSSYYDQRGKTRLRVSKENNMRQSTRIAREKIENIWNDTHDATHEVSQSVKEVQCNYDKQIHFNTAHLTNYHNHSLNSNIYEYEQQQYRKKGNVQNPNKESDRVSKENGSRSTCERIKGKVAIISPLYSSSSNTENDSITHTNITTTTTTTKKSSVNTCPTADSNRTQKKEIAENVSIEKIKSDCSSSNDEDLVSKQSEEEEKWELKCTWELHQEPSGYLCDAEQEQILDHIERAVQDNKSGSNSTDKSNDDISEDVFSSSDEGSDLSVSSWHDESFLVPDERDELSTPPPSCSTAFVNYNYQ